MARAFAGIAFTPNVQTVQSIMGSRSIYCQAEVGATEPVALSTAEIEFIVERDSFYQATVSQSGWPYVQHRGGPPGFLKILDNRTIGYADFSGNRQYISVGNLIGDSRVSLLLMDYAQQRRLKIWGHARLIDENTEPALIAQLATPNYRARIERGIIIHIDAFDWNCPKYITPRYSKEQVRSILSSSMQSAPAVSLPTDAVVGTGPLQLIVSGIRQLTPRIRTYELVAPSRERLPEITAGAHLVIPIRLPDGHELIRQYSIAGNPAQHDAYEIAVLRDDLGRGGSKALHNNWTIGTGVNVHPPVNHFPLHPDDRPALLIAGGIGITPLKAMAHALKARGTPFELHYTGRNPRDMAYLDRLEAEFSTQLHLYFTRVLNATRLDISGLLQRAPANAQIYVCGPPALIDAVLQSADDIGMNPMHIQFESFE